MLTSPQTKTEYYVTNGMCSCCMYTNTAKESAVEGRGSGHWVHDTIDLTALYDHLLTFVVNLGLVSFVYF